MLDTLMKFGAYRVDYFEQKNRFNPEAFGFYIRADIEEGQPYSREAKHHLYKGLNLIHRELGMSNLIGIYLDVDCLKNLQRPAYQQMKKDILNGYFRRILILDEITIRGCPRAELDLKDLACRVGWLEFLILKGTGLRSKFVGEPAIAVI